MVVVVENVVMVDHMVMMYHHPGACRNGKSSEGHRQHAGCDQALGHGRSPLR
jgi:hypothetical protein